VNVDKVVPFFFAGAVGAIFALAAFGVDPAAAVAAGFLVEGASVGGFLGGGTSMMTVSSSSKSRSFLTVSTTGFAAAAAGKDLLGSYFDSSSYMGGSNTLVDCLLG
jgi:hypothetical protein